MITPTKVTTVQPTYQVTTVTTTVENGRDVDEYNRHGGKYDNYYYEERDTIYKETSTFSNTEKIERFDNPQIVINLKDAELLELYYNDTPTINLVVGSTWAPAWGWGWTTVYDPWYYDSWYGPGWYRPFGWYRPWHPVAWGWSWGWGWGPGWYRPAHYWGWGGRWGWGHRYYHGGWIAGGYRGHGGYYGGTANYRRPDRNGGLGRTSGRVLGSTRGSWSDSGVRRGASGLNGGSITNSRGRGNVGGTIDRGRGNVGTTVNRGSGMTSRGNSRGNIGNVGTINRSSGMSTSRTHNVSPSTGSSISTGRSSHSSGTYRSPGTSRSGSSYSGSRSSSGYSSGRSSGGYSGGGFSGGRSGGGYSGGGRSGGGGGGHRH